MLCQIIILIKLLKMFHKNQKYRCKESQINTFLMGNCNAVCALSVDFIFKNFKLSLNNSICINLTKAVIINFYKCIYLILLNNNIKKEKFSIFSKRIFKNLFVNACLRLGKAPDSILQLFLHSFVSAKESKSAVFAVCKPYLEGTSTGQLSFFCTEHKLLIMKVIKKILLQHMCWVRAKELKTCERSCVH